MKKIIKESQIRNIVRCVLKEYLYGSDDYGTTAYDGVYNFYPYEVEFEESYEDESEDFYNILTQFNIKDKYILNFSVTCEYDNSVGYSGSADDFEMTDDDCLYDDILKLKENGYEKFYNIIKDAAESINEDDVEWEAREYEQEYEPDDYFD